MIFYCKTLTIYILNLAPKTFLSKKNCDVVAPLNWQKLVMCVSIYISKCNMQCLNSDFNKLKVDDSTHVKMLIVQKM